MRKTDKEKLNIVKHATSKMLIKKLAIQHGITTKTIKSWIKHFKEGKLLKENNSDKLLSSNTKNKSKEKPFSEVIFKINEIYSTIKDRSVYRYCIKDKNFGFTLCGYASNKTTEHSIHFLHRLISRFQEINIPIKKIITDKKCEISKITDIAGCIGIAKKNHNEIKKYLTFSKKKYSYIKDRTKYDDTNEFLFDSMATVAKNNELLLKKYLVQDLNLKKRIKALNIEFHSSILKNGNNGLDASIAKSELQKKMNLAEEYHKKFEVDNADRIYDKLYHILNDSELDTEMFMNLLLQRGKIFGVKREFPKCKLYLNMAMKIAKSYEINKRMNYERIVIMEYIDIYRIEKDWKMTNYFLLKADKLVHVINNPETTALFYINYGRVISNFNKYAKAVEYYKMAGEIINRNNITRLKVYVDESLASNYSNLKKYDDAGNTFIKMINENVYSEAPYHRALLFARLADIHHLTGNLSKSIIQYEKSLEVIEKQKDIKAFLQLYIVIKHNMAYSLMKMNENIRACKILEENIKIAKENNFSAQLVENLSNIAYAEIELNETNSSQKHLDELEILLKQTENPKILYRFFIVQGKILLKKKLVSKAQMNFEKAIETSTKIIDSKSYYFESNYELVEFFIKTKRFSEAKELNKQILKESKIAKERLLTFKGDLLKNKIRYLEKDETNSYNLFLNSYKESSALKDDQVFYIQKELKSIVIT